mgnify:FL=1
MLAVEELIKLVRILVHDEQETGYDDIAILNCLNAGSRFLRRMILQLKPELLSNVTKGNLNTNENIIELDFIPVKIVDIRINGKRIIYKSRADILNMDKHGFPYAYFITGLKTINLYPMPDKPINYEILAVEDIKEMTLSDDDNEKSPFPNEFDDMLIEYALIRLSMGNEFDMSQEMSVMSQIVAQLENILRERDTVYVISGYYDSLPDDCDVIRAVW